MIGKARVKNTGRVYAEIIRKDGTVENCGLISGPWLEMRLYSLKKYLKGVIKKWQQ